MPDMPAQGFYHCGVKSVGRSKGRSVVAAAAYRSASRLTDERTGLVHDYSRRQGVLTSFIVTPADAPAWAADREQLWSQAERREARANGRLATEFELALPHELSPAQRRELVAGFAQSLADRYGVALDIAIHKPGRGGDHRNFHAHVLASHRELGPDGFGEIANQHVIERAVKGRMKPVKVSGIANQDDIEPLRRAWADHVNRAYADAGLDIEVDHRSHKDRGLDAEPTQHLGPSASAMERRGAVSEIGDINRAIAARNADREALQQESKQITAEIINLDEERDRRLRARPFGPAKGGMVAQQTDALARFQENSAKLEARRRDQASEKPDAAQGDDEAAANAERVRRALGRVAQRRKRDDDDRGPSR
jgi:hypothetical protein